MANEIFYWDSSVFCGFLSKEKDKFAIANQILEEAESGNVTIVTSFMTITEVLCVDGGKPREMTEKQRTLIKGFFKKEYIEWITFSRVIADAARDLCWDLGLKSKDAVHLASAQYLITAEGVEIDAIHSFDSDFIKTNGKIAGVNCPCCKPIPKQGILLLGDPREKPRKRIIEFFKTEEEA